MTLIEALKHSYSTGSCFQRTGEDQINPVTYAGWVTWYPDYLYSDLSAHDLIANDWERIPSENRKVVA